jgi:hypothetical protein
MGVSASKVRMLPFVYARTLFLVEKFSFETSNKELADGIILT